MKKTEISFNNFMPHEANNIGLSSVPIHKYDDAVRAQQEDILAVEEPLEIRLQYGPETQRQSKSLSVTMRTPGSDYELAVGFLFTEGIISAATQLLHPPLATYDPNIVVVSIAPDVVIDLEKLKRNFYTTSSCGVCGKESISSVRTVCPNFTGEAPFTVASKVILTLPQTLRHAQSLFEDTGGIHASALFDVQGHLLLLREDVGRHNALDKLIGASLLGSQTMALHGKVLLLSGRASFELIQKAAMAGIRVVCAVGAPSSLAVQMAQDLGITLIGFLRGKRFNVYSGVERIHF